MFNWYYQTMVTKLEVSVAIPKEALKHEFGHLSQP